MAERQVRRRGQALEDAILEAAWAELAEHGWSAFSIAGVAKRCGTAKPVIYRRWSNRVALAQDMLGRAVAAEEHAFESSGDLRSDLLEFARSMAIFLSGPFGEAVRGVLLERTTGRHSSLFGPEVPAAVAGVVEAALARGELSNRPSPLVQNAGHALVVHELLHVGRAPNDEALQRLVDEVWLPALLAGA